MSTHPSREALHAWLMGDELDDIQHVEGCDECLTDLEVLSSLDPILVRSFLHLTRPEPGFVDRVRTAIERRQQDAESWAAFTDLFSLGWRTIDTVWDEDG